MTGPVTDPVTSGRGVFGRLYHGETRADIVGRWKLWFALSGVVLLIGLAALAVNGLNMGIDFTGGTVWEVEAGDAEVTDVQDAMAELGYEDVQAQEVTQSAGGSDTRFLRIEAEATAEPSAETTDALESTAGALEDLEADVPDSTRGRIDDIRANLDGIEGPFRDDVPEPLAAIDAEIEKLPGTVDDAEEPAAAVRRAVDRMQEQIDALADLEDEERARLSQDVTDRLSELTGTPAAEITVDTVGPSWGQQISEKARNALVVFLLAITLFITIRFELKMAIATVVALFHDLLVVVGMYALFGFPVTPATVIALLTMLGFSIYDGIVVFDRVDENTPMVGVRNRTTYSGMANLSLNQVLMRSLNTSITSLLPILSVLIVGKFVIGESTLEEYGLALFFGLMSGAYSSLFIATPLLALLKEREPRYREVREGIAALPQSAGRGEPDHGATPEPAGVGATAGSAPVASPVVPGAAPRPRKKGRRR